MTGITLKEKSFRNMVDFNKHELLKILKSEDQHAEIIKLPTSILKTLKKNGIITKRWQDNEISERAQEYLTIKNHARAHAVKSKIENESVDSTIHLPQNDIFKINLSRNYPYRTNSPFQILRNGLPIWDLPRILGMIFPSSIANRIIYEVEALGSHGIYEVQLEHMASGIPNITVQSLPVRA